VGSESRGACAELTLEGMGGKLPRWLPKVASATVVVMAGLLAYFHNNSVKARQLAAVQSVAGVPLPGPEILTNFDAISDRERDSRARRTVTRPFPMIAFSRKFARAGLCLCFSGLHVMAQGTNQSSPVAPLPQAPSRICHGQIACGAFRELLNMGPRRASQGAGRSPGRNRKRILGKDTRI